ncbi:MAG: amidohydrolase family protein [Kiritimatiellae bacterium]|nr:amidohydrolase family protein [Kiritimatiellia bacterium]
MDAHEHLLPEQERLSVTPDVVWLFHQYSLRELRCAGMSESDAQAVMDLSVSLHKRWRIFKPFYESIKHTGCAQGVLCAMKDLYGCGDLNDKTYVPVSEEIARQNKPGITDRFLGQKGNIAHILNCNYQYRQPVDYAHPIVSLNIAAVWSPKSVVKDVRELGRKHRVAVTDLDSYLELMGRVYADYRKHKVIGVKTTIFPPARTIDKRRASGHFARFWRGKSLAPDARSSLFSFLQDAAIGYAAQSDFTVAVHCGIGAGVNYDFTDQHVRHMIPLLLRHPGARFDLFHLGYPWMGEAIAIAQSFPNVSLNLCWCHANNPSVYERAIADLVGSVASNKILAMGGDIWRLPDVAYGYLKLARLGLARALSGCVSDGRLSSGEACALAEAWLNSNAFAIYPKLKLPA